MKKHQRFNDNNIINFQEFLPSKKTQVRIIPRNRSQETYFLKLQDSTKTILFAVGPAGTGKTLLATQTAIKLLKDKDIDKIREDCINNNHQILTYQIHTSNLCNQACVTCSSKFSSKWAEIEKRMSIVPTPTFYADPKGIGVNYQTAKRIELLGGEPLFDSRTFDILEQLIKHNNTDCFISIVTNGSISLTDKHHKLLSKFTDLNICISIDGIGPVFEYMRWPGKWDTLTQNIAQYKSIAKSLSVSYTLSSLNALYYDETVSWFQQQNLPFNHNVVTYPNWASINATPNILKQHLKQKNNFIARLLPQTGSISIEDYREKISQQDAAKKIKLEDYMPELAKIIFDN